MLEQLIESRSHLQENKGRTGAFLIISALVLVLCLSFLVWSMFAMSLNLTDDGLELSFLVAPVPVPAAEPPKPEPPQQQAQQQAAKAEIATRQDNIARLDEVQDPPKGISTTPNTQKARPKDGIFKIERGGPETDGSSTGPVRDGNNHCCVDSLTPGTLARNDGPEDEAPVMKPPVAEKVNRPIVRSSIINGKATYLPKPYYSPAAVAVNANGEVNVQVTLDEAGNVISAKAVSGHLMLRQPAEQAARSAKFSPTILNGQRVKVTGLIVYRFSRT